MSELCLNSVVLFDAEEANEAPTLCRVVGLSTQDDALALLQMNTDQLRIEYHHLVSIRERISRGEIKVLDHVTYCWTPATFSQLSDAEQTRIKTEYSRIEPLLASQQNWVFDTQRMHLEIRHRADELDLHRNQIVRPLYRCLAEGGGPLALVSHYAACGQRTMQTFGKKRGRKSRRFVITEDPIHGGVAMTDALREVFVSALRRHLKHGTNIKRIFKKMIDEHFVLGLKITRKGEVKNDYMPTKLRPSLRQFRYFVDNFKHGMSIKRRLLGDKKFKLSGRGIIGKAIDGLFGPTARFEVDATVLDIYAVSELNRAWIIGRPVLYVVIDTFSRMTVGFHLSMEGPSWIEAQTALFNAFNSKVDLCKRYGVEITEEDWPCHHMAGTLQVDRGEWRADAAESGAQTLGFNWSVPGPCRGDWKPVVERNFKLLNDGVIHFLPGAHIKHDRERSARKQKLDACLTMKEIGAILIKSFLLRHSESAPMECIPPAMVENNELEACPLGIWKWGIQNSVGYVKQYSPGQVFTALLPDYSGTVCADGIHWKGLRFMSKRGTQEDWWSRARTRSTWKVCVKADKTDVTGIWVLHESDREWEFCGLAEADQRYRGCSLFEVQDYFAHVADDNTDRATAKEVTDALTRREIEKIAAEAKEKTAAVTEGMSHNERLRDSAAMAEDTRASERVISKTRNRESASGKSLLEKDQREMAAPPTARDPLLAEFEASEGGAA